MNKQQKWTQLLELLDRPAFLVRNGTITQLNIHAQTRLLSVGMEITPLIATGLEEYQALGDDSLCLTLQLCGEAWGACVRSVDEGVHLFLLDEQEDGNALRLLALAAMQLRAPLADALATSTQLLPGIRPESVAARKEAAKMNKSLYELHRIVCNMADAQEFLSGTVIRWENTDLKYFFCELSEKAEAVTVDLGVTITFHAPDHSVVACVDREKLERAFHNLLSNALRFTPRGGMIEISLAATGKQAILRIRDSGEGLDREVQKTLFERFRRSPTIEDGRYGIGLGLLMVRRTAALHGGALLIGPAPDGGTQAALSLALRSEPPAGFRSPRLPVDYTGELDHTLVELSRELPSTVFESLNLL